ncbi:MAG: hypothetical protein HQK49_13885 [Oligoflexia bacterium]|nr:hypothetical protein [Oligoflexia bacterium]
MVKLRYKLFLIVFGFSIVVYAILGSSFYLGLFNHFQQQEEIYLLKIGELCANSIVNNSIKTLDQSNIQKIIQSCQTTKQNIELFFRLQDQNNRIIFNSFSQMYEPFLLESLYQNNINKYRTLQLTPFFVIQLLSLPIEKKDGFTGTLYIGKRKTTWLMLLSEARVLVLTNGLIALFFLLGLSIAFTLIITRPLESLHQFVLKRKKNFKVQLPKLAKDEIGQIGTEFYELIKDLDGKNYIENYTQTLTHELKSPITGIQTAIEILKQDLNKQDLNNKEREFFTEQIEAESSRLVVIIERMLTLTNLEHGQHILNKNKHFLNALLEKTVCNLSTKLSLKNLSVSVLTKVENIYLNVDEDLFILAIQNIIENSIDFAPKNSIITIESEAEEAKEDLIVIRITDQGSGIPDYAINKVFDKFYSLPRPNGGRKSTGLGLCFVKQIIELHSGTITINNCDQLDQSASGAIVKITIPVITHTKLT